MNKELCLILSARIKSIVSEPLTNDSQHELECAADKLCAVLNNDFFAFHQAAESELQRRDEQIGNEYELSQRLSEENRRLKQKDKEQTGTIIELTNEVNFLEGLHKLIEEDELGQAFDIPFSDVKRYLSYLDYHTDSILDTEQNAKMGEFGWRRLLQRYVNELGHFPIKGASP